MPLPLIPIGAGVLAGTFLPVDLEGAFYETWDYVFDVDVQREWYDVWGLGHLYRASMGYYFPDVVVAASPINVQAPEGEPPIPPAVRLIMASDEEALRDLWERWSNLTDRLDEYLEKVDPEKLETQEERNVVAALQAYKGIAKAYQGILSELIGASLAYTKVLFEYLQGQSRNLVLEPITPEEIRTILTIATERGEYNFGDGISRIHSLLNGVALLIQELKAESKAE